MLLVAATVCNFYITLAVDKVSGFVTYDCRTYERWCRSPGRADPARNPPAAPTAPAAPAAAPLIKSFSLISAEAEPISIAISITVTANKTLILLSNSCSGEKRT